MTALKSALWRKRGLLAPNPWSVRALVVLLALGLIAPAPALFAAADPGAPVFSLSDTGYPAGEPTLGITANGCIFFQATELRNYSSAPATSRVLRSCDRGSSWTVVLEDPQAGFDSYVRVDPVTDRVLLAKATSCLGLAASDDLGVSWEHRPYCNETRLHDAPKLTFAPWHDPAPPHTYAQALHVCWNGLNTYCSVSSDGGVTFSIPHLAFPAVFASVDAYLGLPGVCSGVPSKVASAPDGTIYVSREFCGQPWIAVSTDNGTTWLPRPVSFGARVSPPVVQNAVHVAVAPDGSVFVAWPGTDGHHHVARSADQGLTWTEESVSPPDVRSVQLPVIVAGAGGVATAYIGTRDTDLPAGDAPQGTRWAMFLSYSRNPADPAPTWSTVQITPDTDPILIGCFRRYSIFTPAHINPDPANPVRSCTSDPGRLLDFNDLLFSPDGRLALAYTAAGLRCPSVSETGCERGYVALQTGGSILGP